MAKFDELKAQAKLAKNKLDARQDRRLAYFPHAMGLTERPTGSEIEEIKNICTGRFSIDHTCQPFNISFEIKSDMLLTKLGFSRPGLFCEYHQY